MDPRAINIFQSKINITEYKNEVGLVVVHDVKASMKSDTYKVKLAFTKQTIIACTCTCKAGSQGSEK